jgi:hypothetical protein
VTKKRTIRVVIKHSDGLTEGMFRIGRAMQSALHPLRRLAGSVRFQPATKRIKVSESVSLGGKRFIAVVRVDNQEFIVGGGSDSVVLLNPPREKAEPSFANAFQISAKSLAREYPTQ